VARDHRRTVLSRRTKLVMIFLFFIDFPLWMVFGQIGELNEGISVSISPKRPSLGEKFKYEIMVRGNFFSSVTVIPPAYLGGFKILEGPYIRPNVEENGIIITYILKALRKGERILRSFTVKVNSDVYKTPPLKVDIINIRPTVYWRVKKGKYFVGEVFPITLELILWDKLAIPLRVDTRAPRDSWFEEFVSGESLKRDNFEGKERFVVPLKNFLVTFGRAGRFRIPPARVILPGRVKLYTPLKIIEVKKLPKGVESTYAVGNFDYRHRIDRESIELGKTFSVTLTVTGVGNFNYFKFPVPVVEGVKGIIVEDVEEVKPTVKGYAGYKRRIYLFKPENRGKIYCTIPDFPYFDRKDKVVRVLKGDRYTISVTLPAKSSPKVSVFSIKGYGEFVKSSERSLYNSWFLYLVFFPGPLLYLIFLLAKKYKKKRRSLVIMGVLAVSFVVFQSSNGDTVGVNGSRLYPERVKNLFFKASSAYNNKDYSLAGRLFGELGKIYPHNKVLLYNMAVCYYRSENLLEAMHILRTILRRYPEEREVRDFLNLLETKLLLKDQIPPSLDINPERLINLLIVLFNLLFVFIIVYDSSKRIGFLFSSFLVGIAFLAVFGYLVYSYYYSSRERGIVGTNWTYVLRIPEKTSSVRSKISGGTSFDVLGRAKGYVLVRTGSGSEGWIVNEDILLD